MQDIRNVDYASEKYLYEAPTYAVESSIYLVAKNLRTARLRRNLTLKEIAEKIGN